MTYLRMRRFVALAGAALLAGGALAACGSSDDDASSDSAAFSFKDDLGVQIDLDAMPERLIVQSSMAAALTDLGLGDKIVGVFGPLRNADGDADSQVKGLDIESVEDLTGEGEYGDVSVEDAATLKPDLIVTSSYLGDDLWYINDKTATDLKNLAPILTVSFDGETLPGMLDATERAAEALGADLDADDVTAAHDDFEAAGDRVKEASEALGDRTVLAGSASTDTFYVSNPAVSPDLKYWVDELGVPITIPDNPDEGGYFESLSWENADKYPADVFLWDDRIGTAGLDLMKKQPVFATLAAAKNDAFIPWTSVFPPSYAAVADTLDTLADDLEGYAPTS